MYPSFPPLHECDQIAAFLPHIAPICSLCSPCRTYEDLEREVSQILGFRWYALNDKQFKLTPLNLTIPYYYEGHEENDLVDEAADAAAGKNGDGGHEQKTASGWKG